MTARSFSDLLKLANARLKTAKLGVSIQQKGNRLYIRGTFPPKPGSNKKKSHQQEIALKTYANPEGLRQAEKEAKKIGAALALKEFDWSDYRPEDSTPPKTLIVADCIASFEENYFQMHQRTPKTESSWKKNHLPSLRRLPQDQPLSLKLMLDVTKWETQPDSCPRSKTCSTYKQLAEFIGWNAKEIERLKGKYSSKENCPRDLPSDEDIIEWFYKISDPRWRWAYGMLAAYGLRPHEVFHLNTQVIEEGGNCLTILENTKTGFRYVFPFHPEWVELFNLREKHLPNVRGKCNSDLGDKVSRYFRSVGIPFPPYNLRHAWAVRTLILGIDVALAARWMGHGVGIHTRTYHRWIAPQTEQEMYERSIGRKIDSNSKNLIWLPPQEALPTSADVTDQTHTPFPSIDVDAVELPPPPAQPDAQLPSSEPTSPPKQRKRGTRNQKDDGFEQLDIWAS